MIFQKSRDITITIKLYSGLHRQLNRGGYNPDSGLTMTVKENTRLKKLLSSLGLKNLSTHAYFINGERATLRSRLKPNDEVMCMRPSAGG